MKTVSMADQSVYKIIFGFKANLARLGRNLNAFFSIWGVSFNSFSILTYLYGRPDGATVTEMEDALLIARQTMIVILDGLERKDVVKSYPHPYSRGPLVIRLTDAGRKKVRILQKETHNAVKAMRTTMQKKEMRELIDLTQKLVDFWERTATSYDGTITPF